MPCDFICSMACAPPTAATYSPLRSKCFGKTRKYSAAPAAVRTAGANHAARMILIFFLTCGFQPMSFSPAPESSTPIVGTNIIAAITSCPAVLLLL